ncbi:MAG: formate--tetrahydrofolate ligase [Thermoplasmata archaeon]|nr:formate--tetrahydrofolate ligase [Thermoplasmata archaeon]
MANISEVVTQLELPPSEVTLLGRTIAKVPVATVRALVRDRLPGTIVLVTGMTPTPHGEGKTVTAIGLAMGLRRLGRRSVVVLRQPSLGPTFGLKGGAAGSGRTKLEPFDDINLGLTGDIEAVTAAHNLLSAMVDNQLYHSNPVKLDAGQVVWPRALDTEDRTLRAIETRPEKGPGAATRRASFLITPASEVMSIHGLAEDYADLKRRLGKIVVGFTASGAPVRAADLSAAGAMAALLRRSLEPNVVQTSEGTPALVHGGPFGNLSHGTASRISIELGRATSEFCVVEVGFSTELGLEKFVDIVARAARFHASVAVIVVTARAIRYHGVPKVGGVEPPPTNPLGPGLENLEQHIANIRAFGLLPIVALNRFEGDSEGDLAAIASFCREQSVPCELSTARDQGGGGAEQLAKAVIEAASSSKRSSPIYELEDSLPSILGTLTVRLYGGSSVELLPGASADLERLMSYGEARGPICVAKTPLSLSDDPKRLGRPRGFTVRVNRFARASGAEFTLAYLGTVTAMPGLPEHPAAERIDLTADGRITGLA